MIDFYIICLTDDWEMSRVFVKYPDNLGSFEYFGGGNILLMGYPLSFSSFFPFHEGLWTFEISGILKSDQHYGEIFDTRDTDPYSNAGIW